MNGRSQYAERTAIRAHVSVSVSGIVGCGRSLSVGYQGEQRPDAQRTVTDVCAMFILDDRSLIPSGRIHNTQVLIALYSVRFAR